MSVNEIKTKMDAKKKKAILSLIDSLKDLDYFIFAGFAVYFHTEGKRGFEDIDILFKYEDLIKFAKRVGGKPKKRKIKKGDFITEDYFLCINYKGQEIEAIGILPDKEKEIESFEKQFKNRERVDFFGKDLFLSPKEGTIVHKAIVGRKKDIDDLILLKGNINADLLKEIAILRGEHDKVIKALTELGYNL